MNASQTTMHHRLLPENVAHGSVTEGIGALCVVILAILGLAGVLTNVLASIATIVAGLVFLGDGMLAKSAVRTLNARGTPSGMGAGASAGFLGGITGIVLGILSLFRMPDRFVAVAVLVFGVTLFLSGGTLAHLNALLRQPEGTGVTEKAGNGDIFMGLGVTVLGILAVIGLIPMTLALVGLLGLGTAALFSGRSIEPLHESDRV